MKKCSGCGETKPFTEFHVRRKAKDGLQAWCRSCENLAGRKWKKNNPEKVKEQQKKQNAKHGSKNARLWRARHPERDKDSRLKQRLKKRQFVSDYKKVHGCEVCKIHDPRVLDLHHRNGDDKVMAVSQMICYNSLDEVQKEMDKCRVICANCHRIEHYNQRD